MCHSSHGPLVKNDMFISQNNKAINLDNLKIDIIETQKYNNIVGTKEKEELWSFLSLRIVEAQKTKKNPNQTYPKNKIKTCKFAKEWNHKT